MKLTSVVAIVTLFNSVGYSEERTDDPKLSIDWNKNYLTIRGAFPGDEISILYLEAYCRPGSSKRDWHQTVIPHRTEKLEQTVDGKRIRLRDTVEDGVIVEHTISANEDEVDFRLSLHNPTKKASEAHWAQPCMRVGKFTGAGNADARATVPKYARQSFIFVDDELTMLPTTPWELKALYTPGQVYCPAHVNRDDVNPRPLSSIVPSNGLCGCFSADGRMILAVAWEPYQEVFQGVIGCMHNDFRIGELKPGEHKTVRGKIYIVPANIAKLKERFVKDFSEQAAGKQKQ